MFLLGVFWKRASARSAFITLLTGILLGLATFYLDWNGLYKGDFMLTAFGLFVFCILVMITTSYLLPEPLKADAKPLIWDNWAEPLRNNTGGRGLT